MDKSGFPSLCHGNKWQYPKTAFLSYCPLHIHPGSSWTLNRSGCHRRSCTAGHGLAGKFCACGLVKREVLVGAESLVIGLNLPVKPAELHEFLHLFIVSIVAVGIIEDGKNLRCCREGNERKECRTQRPPRYPLTYGRSLLYGNQGHIAG